MLHQRYREVRQYTCQLCRPLKIEDYIPQPVEFASPPKWHLAHTTWFFEQMVLLPYCPDYTLYDRDFNYLFNSYYNNVGDRIVRTHRGSITRPGVEEVYAYRKYVDGAMEQLLSQPLDEDLSALIVLGLHHEQQHQELLITDLKYALGDNPIFPVYREDFNLLARAGRDSGRLPIAEGVYEVGFAEEGFCYDNELGRHKVYLEACTVDKGLVTNGEYLEFMAAGAYEKFDYWLDEGWSWVNRESIRAPLYWHRIDGEWHHYTLAGLQPVDPEGILGHVSFYEAAAYAEWRGRRLPTEFEWEVAAPDMEWGQRWEWTNSAYLPYPRFNKAPGAVGEYNGKFMVNQMVLRGASIATSPGHSRSTYRNFFHPDARWQYTGIRLAQ
ncbi:MAG: ergothioneine biosynthesis protein EgtB [Bacteroidota bacterium]